MAIKHLILTLFFGLVLCEMSFSQETRSEKSDRKTKKELKIASYYQKTKALVESGNFDYETDWVFPLGKPRISLLGNINRLRFEDNMLEANLPYFGTRYNDGYASAGINFKSEIDEYKVDFQDDDYRILITFVVADEKERYQFDLEIESDGSSQLYFASNKRNAQT